MEAITIGQIVSWLAVLAGVSGSITTIYAFVSKIHKKRAEREKNEIMALINQQLVDIKEQNKELKEQNAELRKEMILIMKLNQTMVSELKSLGHINGETSQALQELTDYLINK